MILKFHQKILKVWLVANEGNITVALDVNITEELQLEGIAREFVSKIFSKLEKRNRF